ncbi:MAG: tRNA (adenosine(37)-N6)-threonylcarbamoyltransferase complex ATPase subunit type 1 TsaE [Candidatus Parcubacteria bacterium]|nr:tRNA (adenosine(37)-N6)-threonylcarbamoyltransferase complex ATPase subunit type 1 TsaE [Candidatus Parcubacteria bacterium]
MERKTLTFITHSPEETQQIGTVLGELVEKLVNKRAIVIGLNGVLGAGKTELVKGIAHFFNIQEKILSPTFVIAKEFKVKRGHFINFWHFDLYRFNEFSNLIPLGWSDLIKEKENIILVEWADKFKKQLLPDYIVSLQVVSKTERSIIIKRGRIYK